MNMRNLLMLFEAQTGDLHSLISFFWYLHSNT